MFNKFKEIFFPNKEGKRRQEHKPVAPQPQPTFEEQLLLTIQRQTAKYAQEQERLRKEEVVFEQKKFKAKQVEKKIRLTLEKLLIDKVEPLLKTIMKHHAPGAEISRRSRKTYDGKYVAEMSVLWDNWESDYQYSFKMISVSAVADNEYDTSPTTVIIGETGQSFDLKYAQKQFENALLHVLENNKHVRSGARDLGGGP